MARQKKMRRSEEVHRVVAELFARKGYHSTSMREIARELGMSQSSLYYYFKSKEDILFALMNGAMDEALTTLERICAADLPPADKLEQVLDFYARYYTGNQERETLLVHEMNSLGPVYREVLIGKQRRYVRLITSMLGEVADTGAMKSIHPTVATFAFFGMVHYTVKWYHRDGPVDVDELASIFVEIFTRGILA